MRKILFAVAIAAAGGAAVLGVGRILGGAGEAGRVPAVVAAGPADAAREPGTAARGPYPERDGAAEAPVAGAPEGVRGASGGVAGDVPPGGGDPGRAGAAGAAAAVSSAARADASRPIPGAEARSEARASDPAAVAPAETQEDAEAVLRRAAAAYERVGSLRAEFAQEVWNPLLGKRIESRGTLFQRHPDRFLMRFEEPAGDVVVSDGRWFWVYYPSVDPKQVIRMPAGPGGAGAVDLRAQFLGDPVERFAATLEGTERVLGREARVLVLDPRGPAPYRLLRVWVDSGDGLARRFEITEENGTVRRVELRGLEVNPALGDSLFRFTPPEGARVIDRG